MAASHIHSESSLLGQKICERTSEHTRLDVHRAIRHSRCVSYTCHKGQHTASCKGDHGHRAGCSAAHKQPSDDWGRRNGTKRSFRPLLMTDSGMQGQADLVWTDVPTFETSITLQEATTCQDRVRKKVQCETSKALTVRRDTRMLSGLRNMLNTIRVTVALNRKSIADATAPLKLRDHIVPHFTPGLKIGSIPQNVHPLARTR